MQTQSNNIMDLKSKSSVRENGVFTALLNNKLANAEPVLLE